MVKYIKGDVLNCKATLVAHQVNAFGVMGGGIAAAIWPLLTPESQNAYVEKCRHNAKLPVTEWMGSIQILDTKREDLKICNLFTQFPAPVDGSFDLTAYNYLRQALLPALTAIADKVEEVISNDLLRNSSGAV